MPPSRLNASTRKPAVDGRPNDDSVASPNKSSGSKNGEAGAVIAPIASSSTAPKIKLKFKTGTHNGGGNGGHASGDEVSTSADERTNAPTVVQPNQPLKLKLSLGGTKINASTPSPEPPTPKLKLSFSSPASASGSATISTPSAAVPSPSIASSRMAPRPKARAGSVLGPSRGGVVSANIAEDLSEERPRQSVGGEGNTTGAGPSHDPSSIPKVTLKLPTPSIPISAPMPSPAPTSATPPAPNPTSTPNPIIESKPIPKPKATTKKPAKSRGKGWSAKRKLKPPTEYDAMGYPIGVVDDGVAYENRHHSSGYAQGGYPPNAVAGSSALPMGGVEGGMKFEDAELDTDGPARKRIKLSSEPKVEVEDGAGAVDHGGDVDMETPGDPDDPYADAYEAPQAFVDSRFPSVSVPPSVAGREEPDHPDEEDRKPNIAHGTGTPATPSQPFDIESGGNETRDPSRFNTPGLGGSENGGSVVTPGGMNGLEYAYNFTPGGPGGPVDPFGLEGRHRGPAPRKHWMKLKKSLKEVMKKVIQDMKRKDGYGLFLDPVDPIEYPGYFEAIGGEQNAMDLATMERRLDDGMYRSVDEFEADIELMISAAETFNAEDSLVAREASKMRILAKKHITRSRPIVRTPSPEPRGTPGMFSGAATPGGADGDDFDRDPSASMPPGGRGGRISTVEVPLKQTIPEGMLMYPNNSDVARAVAFYTTGGQRIRGARERKGRERWDGQWREWNTEGDKNLREVDDVRDILKDGFVVDKLAMPDHVDHQSEVMQATSTWYPPPLLTGVQSEEVAPTIPTRPIVHTDLGIYGDMARHYGYKEWSAYSEDDIRGKIGAELGKTDAPVTATPEDDFGEAVTLVRKMTTGADLSGEAYLRSIESFIAGAVQASSGVASPTRNKRKIEDPGVRERRLKKAKMESSASSDDEGVEATQEGAGGAALAIKEESLVTPSTAIPTPDTAESTPDQAALLDHLDLERYVRTEWRSGWLDKGARRLVREAHQIYEAIAAGDMKEEAQEEVGKRSIAAIDALLSEPSTEVPSVQSVVQASIKRVPIERDLRLYSARRNGLDLASLLTAQADFTLPTSLGGPPASGGGRQQWFVRSLEITGKQILDASMRRERGLLADAKRAMFDQAKLKKLRLDLLGLAKNVPVHELSTMTSVEAEMLPAAVRGLIKIEG